MNLEKLFETQRALDERIIKSKNITETDLLPKKILSLQVELGELANELPEVFKFWSNKKNNYEKALVEYCDCLHFILSIGNELEYAIDETNIDECIKFESLTEQFTESFILNLWVGYESENTNNYEPLLKTFLGLGEMLGFTWEQIEQAYYAKNKINHQRQDGGY